MLCKLLVDSRSVIWTRFIYFHMHTYENRTSKCSNSLPIQIQHMTRIEDRLNCETLATSSTWRFPPRIPLKNIARTLCFRMTINHFWDFPCYFIRLAAKTLWTKVLSYDTELIFTSFVIPHWFRFFVSVITKGEESLPLDGWWKFSTCSKVLRSKSVLPKVSY